MSAPPGPARERPRRRRSLWIGLALVSVGVVGSVVLGTSGLWAGSSTTIAPLGPNLPQSFTSLGERIFLTGTDASGRPIARQIASGYGMMFGQGGCATCHGRDGRGGTVNFMMGSFQTPDIRWKSLTSPMTNENGDTHPPYDETSFAQAVRDGTDPAGDQLDAPMPRWQLTDSEVTALIDYLKSLP